MTEPPDPTAPVKTECSFNFYVCGVCRYQTKSILAISQHLRHHHGAPTQPFHCSDAGPEPYFCSTCRFETHLAINFNTHTAPRNLSDITEVCKVYACRNCDFRTFSLLVFIKHAYNKCKNRIEGRHRLCKKINVYNDKHGEYLKCHRFLRCIPYNNIGWLKCQHCSYEAKMRGDVKSHMGAYHMLPQRMKWFECEQCLFNVKQIFHLREHLLTNHPQDAPCFDC